MTGVQTCALPIFFRGGAHGLAQFAAVSDGGAIALAPTGGYLIGMLLAGWIVGRLADLGWDRTILGTVGAMLIGTLIIYAAGASWLSVSQDLPIAEGIAKGVLPFLFGDALKLLAAVGVFPSAWWYVNNIRGAGPR